MERKYQGTECFSHSQFCPFYIYIVESNLIVDAALLALPLLAIVW